MKMLVKAKVTAIENERDVKVVGKDQYLACANAILDCGSGDDYICAKVYGKDKITVCKQKMLAEIPVDMVLSIIGRVRSNKDGSTFYDNAVSVKWILS